MIYSVPDPIIPILGYIAVKYELFPNNARIQQNNCSFILHFISDSSAILKYESSNEPGLREFAEKTRSASAVAEYYERMEN